MKRETGRNNLIMGIFCAVLLLAAWVVFQDIDIKNVQHKKTVITIGVFSDSYWGVQNGNAYKILDDAIKVYEKKYPNVKVQYEKGIMMSDYSEWLAQQVMKGETPDLFFVLGEDFNNISETGVLKDLSSLIKTDQDFEEKAFFSSVFQDGKYKGTQYALPYECAPKLMFVNKTILNQEKIPIPDKNWTWDDFYDICSRVTKDTDGNGMIDQFGEVGYTWKEAFESNGVQLFDKDGTKCRFTGEGVEDSLKFIEKLDKINEGYSITTRDFDLGNVVFQPMSFSEFRAYQPYPLSVKKYSGFEWGCIPMPAGPKGDNISSLDTLKIGMNNRTKHEKAAWNFIKTLTCDEQIQSEIFKYSEGVSVLKSVTGSNEILAQSVHEAGDSAILNIHVLCNAVERAVVTPAFCNLQGAESEVEKAVNSIIGSNSNMRMELIIWNRELNKYLQD